MRPYVQWSFWLVLGVACASSGTEAGSREGAPPSGVTPAMPVSGSGAAGRTGGAPITAGCGDVALDYLAPTCTFVVCHDGQSGNALDLLSPGLPERLVGRASTSLKCGGRLYIDPAAPEQSLLLRKLDPDRPCGDRMPPAAMATPAERACLLEWIKAAVTPP